MQGAVDWCGRWGSRTWQLNEAHGNFTIFSQSLGLTVAFDQWFIVVPTVLLISMLPISIAGWGVRESAMVMAFAYCGLPQADGLLVSALLGFAIFVIGIIGGLVWVIGLPGLRLLKPAVTPPRPL